MKTKNFYALMGIFWFLMDVCWSWKFPYIALVFGSLAVISSMIKFFSNEYFNEVELFLTTATFSWIMMNMSFLAIDIVPSITPLLRLLALIFTFLTILSLCGIAIVNREFFKNFRKL